MGRLGEESVTAISGTMAKMKAAILAAAAILCGTPASGADFGLIGGGIRPDIEVSTFRERKFERVVRQEYDFSCGSAALATLLTFHYDKKITESDAFTRMWAIGDKARIKKLGFSLMEMKKYLEGAGYKADGFKLTLDRLQEIGVPGIALIDVKGYKHFVVIKGVDDRRVLVGDPSAGVIWRSRAEFEDHWDGVILIVRSDVKQGKESFNMAADWDMAPGAPFHRAGDQETLQSLLLNQTRPSFSGFSINTVLEFD